MIELRTISRRWYSGNGDMDLTVEPPFAGAWAIAYIRCHFRTLQGDPTTVTTTNPLTISLDSDKGVAWDVEILKENGIGSAQDLNVRFRNPEEIAGFAFAEHDKLTFAWTDPVRLVSTATIGWGLEIGFAPMT